MHSLRGFFKKKTLPRFFLLGLLFFLPLGAHSDQWDGYNVHSVDSARLEELILSLKKAGVDDVLSSLTVEVAFQDFTGLERVPLSSLFQRLHSTDPRLDPYLLSLNKLFAHPLTEEVAYIYISNAYPESTVGPIVEGYLLTPPGEPLGLTSSSREYLVLFWLGGCLLIFFVYPRFRKYVLVSSLPVTLMVVLSGGELYLTSLFLWAVAAGWYWFNERKWMGLQKPWDLGVVLGGGVLLSLALLLETRTPTGLILFLVFSGVLAGGSFGAQKLRKRALDRLIHPLFIPLKLDLKLKVLKARNFPWPWVSAASLLILPLLFLGSGSTYRWISPVPVPEFIEEPWTLSSLKVLFQEETQAGIPGPGTFVAHRVFQEGFLFGAAFGIPDSGYQVSLKDYYREDGRIREKSVVKMVFDNHWLENLKNSLPVTDPGRLFLAQRAPFRLVDSTPAGEGVSWLWVLALPLLFLTGLALRMIWSRRGNRQRIPSLLKYELRSDQSA